MSENVKQIIQSHLKEIGADGLYDKRFDIGIDVDRPKSRDTTTHLISLECVPGYKHPDGKIHPTKPIPKNDLFGELKT